MRNLAIVPARGGSKRLENKNIREFTGKALILHTLDAVIESKCFEKIIVTSDSDFILEVCQCRANGNIEFHKRPRHLATDHSTVLETIDFLIDREYKNNESYDIVGYFLPTAPLRKAKEIIKAMGYMNDKIDNVISITDYEFPPQLGLIMNSNNNIHAYDKSDPWIKGKSRSQDYPKIYRPNGAIYLSWWKSILINKNFFKGKTLSYYMPPELSVDIDTELDMIIGEAIVRYYNL